MNAKEARRRTAQNKERQNKIKELIKRAEKNIESAIELGYRREATIYAGYCDSNGSPQYPEVVEHFRNLGYNCSYCYGTNLYEVKW